MSVGWIVLNGLTGLALAISVVTDLRTRKILNVVTYPAMLLGLGLHLVLGGWAGEGDLGFKWSLIGLFAGGIPFLVISAVDPRAFGMGDVKLMAAVGALKGFPFVLHALLYTALAGGVLAVVVLLWKGRFLGTLGGMVRKVFGAGSKEAEGGEPETESGERPKIYIPYGVAIAAGTLWAFALEYLQTGAGS